MTLYVSTHVQALKRVREMELYEDSEEWSTLSQDQQKEKEEELQTVVSDAKETNEMASRSVYMVTMVASTTSR